MLGGSAIAADGKLRMERMMIGKIVKPTGFIMAASGPLRIKVVAYSALVVPKLQFVARKPKYDSHSAL